MKVNSMLMQEMSVKTSILGGESKVYVANSTILAFRHYSNVCYRLHRDAVFD